MANSIIEAAKKEEDALTRELEGLPVFQKLQHIRRLIALYESIEARDPASKIVSVRVLSSSNGPRPGTKAAQVDEAVAKFLNETGRRASSGELLPVVLEAGIELSGQIPAKTLSAFLTNSTRFNNVKGQGYGLIEWGETSGPAAVVNSPDRAIEMEAKDTSEQFEELLGQSKDAKPNIFD